MRSVNLCSEIKGMSGGSFLQKQQKKILQNEWQCTIITKMNLYISM